jgi:hypothetical protein
MLHWDANGDGVITEEEYVKQVKKIMIRGMAFLLARSYSQPPQMGGNSSPIPTQRPLKSMIRLNSP